MKTSGTKAPEYEDQLEAALKELRNGSTQKAAAQSTGVSVERFRKFIYSNKLAELDGFLNVIEAIFSGLARAVIHNSNYQSKDEAKAAIDRYFSERNAFFKLNP